MSNLKATINDLKEKEQQLNVLLEKIENDSSMIAKVYESFKVSNSLLDYSFVTNDYVDSCPKLFNIINTLITEDLNPFKNWKLNEHRKYKAYKMDNRGTAVSNDKDVKETMIQRHLIRCKAYEEILGKMIGYEVTIPGGYKRKFPIDLISYKKDDSGLSLYLIELKKCKYGVKGSDNKEIILRAISEIATYYQVFKAAINCEDDGLAQELVDRIGEDVTIDDIRKAKIYKVIIGPKKMIETKSLIENRLKLDSYKFFVIESINSNIEFSMNSTEQLFKIYEVK